MIARERPAPKIRYERRYVELNFDGECTEPGCRQGVTPGAKRCSRHAHPSNKRRQRGFWNDGSVALLCRPSDRYPRPDWMLDPSLLPKRPPGVAA